MRNILAALLTALGVVAGLLSIPVLATSSAAALATCTASATQSIGLRVDAPPGTLQVVKWGLDSRNEMRYLLADAHFTVVTPNGEELTGVSDEEGSILLTDLSPGDYVVTETVPPSGYLLHSEPFAATVVSGQTTVVNVPNSRMAASPPAPPQEGATTHDIVVVPAVRTVASATAQSVPLVVTTAPGVDIEAVTLHPDVTTAVQPEFAESTLTWDLSDLSAGEYLLDVDLASTELSGPVPLHLSGAVGGTPLDESTTVELVHTAGCPEPAPSTPAPEPSTPSPGPSDPPPIPDIVSPDPPAGPDRADDSPTFAGQPGATYRSQVMAVGPSQLATTGSRVLPIALLAVSAITLGTAGALVRRRS